jgi:PAS domain S-box-containing protein
MTVIPNNQAHKTRERAVAEARLFTSIAAVAAKEDDLRHILHMALTSVREVITFTGGSVALIENDDLIIHAAYGPFADAALGYCMPRNAGPSWLVIETGQPFLSNDLSATAWRATSAFQSYLAVPLTWREEIVGLLEIDSTQTDAFTADDAELLQNIAMLLGGPMALARQVHQLRVEITEHKRTEQRLAVQYAITNILANSASFPAAAPHILQTIAEYLGWNLGFVWCIDREMQVLKCSTSWSAPLIGASEFQALSRRLQFPPGIGLPGRVWQSGHPLWLVDVQHDTQLPRQLAAAQAGLHGALSFPICGYSEIFGTFEFFSREVQNPDEDLLKTMAALGTQIGQFIDRKRAERAQNESEKYRSAMLETALDAIVGMDHAGYITEFNPAAEQVFGYSRAVALGQEMAELIIPPQFRELHRRGLQHYVATGAATVLGKRIEITAMRADGSEFPVELSITPIPTDGLPQFTGFIRDITKRKQAEKAIRFQAQLLDIVEQAVVAMDTSGAIIYWNRFAETLYGWSAAEVLGRDVLEVVIAADEQEGAAETMNQLRSGMSWSGEYRVQRRDGSRFPVLITASPIYADDKLVGIVGAATDISERKLAEEGQRFLADASSVLGSSLDYEPTLQSVARMAVPFLADWCIVDLLQDDGSIRQTAVAHIDPATVDLARTLREAYPPDPDEPHPIWQVLRSSQAMITPEVTDDDHALRARDDEHLRLLRAMTIRSHMVVPLLARGRRLGAISFIAAQPGRYRSADLRLAEDLAHRAALAIDNARLYREAQAAIEMRNEFLSIASHELRTPLTTLLGHTQALQRRVTRDQLLNDRDQRALTVIEQQALRLNKQIGTLLDLSRIELGQFNLDDEPVNLVALAQRIVAEIEPTLERHTLQISLLDPALVVMGDAARLEQVLQNLLQNAIKYSPNGGTIRIQLERQADQAVLMVTDPGVGIPEAARPHLFQRFYRASNVISKNITGLGIGLYLVNLIVTLHHGTIEYISAEGQGTTFTVRLPLQTADPS